MTDATATDPPPIAPTGDEEADAELALLRAVTRSMHEHLDHVAALSAERQRIVMSLRGRDIKYGTIAAAVPTTEQTIFKVRREGQARHNAGDHAVCSPLTCPAVQQQVPA
jgi:hypothetical protein